MTTKKAKDFCGEVDKTEDEITQKNKRTQFFKDNVYDDNNIDLVNDLDIDRLQNYCDQYKSTDSNIDKSNAKNIIERYDGSFCDNKFHSRDYRSNKKIFCSNPLYSDGCRRICHTDENVNADGTIYVNYIKQGKYYVIVREGSTDWSSLAESTDPPTQFKVNTKFRASRDGIKDDGTGIVTLSERDEDADIKNHCVQTTKSNLKTFGVALGHSLGQLSGVGSIIDQYTSDNDGYNWGPSKVKQLQSKLEMVKWAGITEIMKKQTGGSFTQYDNDGNELSDKQHIDGVDSRTLKDIQMLFSVIDRFDKYVETKLDSEIKTFNYTNIGSLILLYIISFVLLSLTVWKLK